MNCTSREAEIRKSGAWELQLTLLNHVDEEKIQDSPVASIKKGSSGSLRWERLGWEISLLLKSTCDGIWFRPMRAHICCPKWL
jgi:hypothetical protein